MTHIPWILCLALLLTAQAGWCQANAPRAREVFELDGHAAFILAPAESARTATGKPWVWYAPTLGKNLPGNAEQWMFDRLLVKGIAIAGIDVGESNGNPQGRAAFEKLYVELTTRRGFSAKPVLLARSRGGLMLYNWAAEHPQSVGAVAGIYPVCNLASWPGLKKAAPAYNLTPEELQDQLPQHNPIDRLEPLAKARVPIMHLQGDKDHLVPHEHNTALLAQRYEKLGGPITVELIPGGGHDLKPHWFTSQTLVDFMIRHALHETAEPSRD